MVALRVMAMCGFTQNAHIYSKQLGAIRKTCKEVEFVFCEPPIVVKKADMPWNSGLSEFASDATTEEEQQTPETTPRAWWLTSDRVHMRHFDETVEYLRDFLVKNGPFDGVMGFSQGACMAALLSALLENPTLHPAMNVQPRLAQFKFVIGVGGFFPTTEDPSFYPWFPLPAHVYTLHVIGRNDTLVTEERTRGLVAQCENARVEFHEGGHFTPSKASWRHFFNAYIMSFAPGGDKGDVPPPSAFGPKSGANTPITTSVPGTPDRGTPVSPPRCPSPKWGRYHWSDAFLDPITSI